MGAQTRSRAQTGKHICVGFFIGPGEALTAKHCFEGTAQLLVGATVMGTFSGPENAFPLKGMI